MAENLCCSHICKKMNEFFACKISQNVCFMSNILSRVLVIVDGVRIGNWIY
jgi:hypothetical protein